MITLIVMSLVENVESPCSESGGFLIMRNPTELKVFHRLFHILQKSCQKVLTKLNLFAILITSIKQEGESKMNNQFTNTYDYYKNRPTQQTWYETYFYNENGHVFFEAPNTPRQCMKGVWQVIRPFDGVSQFVPEGDPQFDKTGYLMVWGKFQLNGNPSANQIAEQYA